MKQQQLRWMMLGWLGRIYHLTDCALDRKYTSVFTMSERVKLARARDDIYTVLSNLRNRK